MKTNKQRDQHPNILFLMCDQLPAEVFREHNPCPCVEKTISP